MKAIRTVFYLLLACTIVLALMTLLPVLGLRAPARSGEAQRLARQLAPEKIRILPLPGEASSAPVMAGQSAPAGSRQCLVLTGLNGELIEQARGRLDTLGNDISLRATGLGTVSYWINMPPSGGKAGADERIEMLKREGITDYYVIREPGANQYAVSLGLYRTEEQARRHLQTLTQRGVQARISVRDTSGNKARLEISGAQEIVERFAREFATTHAGVGRDACEPS